MKQTSFLKREPSAYGGSLLKTRRGRARPRPLATRETMHLVLRSTRARGEWSFRRPANDRKVREIIDRFARKRGVRVLQLANAGNHLHLHVQLTNRQLYRPFIRAVTAAIAMAVTGASRWKKSAARFWDARPFSRIVHGFRARLTLRDYLHVNELEGQGLSRVQARFALALMPTRPPRPG